MTARAPKQQTEEQPSRRADALAELQATLDRAGILLRSIELSSKAPAAGNVLELEHRLNDIEQDRDELSRRLAEYEQQTGRLMNLYVATYQLHATLDPDEVQSTIAEIATNLLGAQRFALLFWKGDGSECEIALGHGLEDDTTGYYQGGRYAGGDPAVDATLSDGLLRIGPIEGSEAVAAVPLTVQGAVVGALVILKLFEHKAMLRADDRELLDLLAAHSASALFAARVYHQTDRKLKTLESLIQLVKRG
ncbi:MAG TPA: GAF domain-containing protein [Myxococcales bacterium]|nr:GAF domain-containing protein [Myxococcales bacterium]